MLRRFLATALALEHMGGQTVDVYLLLEEVGSGASGTAHLAVRADARTDELFVVKKLRPEVALQPEHLARFSHEAQIAVVVDHPNVVQVVDVVLAAEAPFIVMRYVEGPTLSALLQKLRANQRALSVPAAVGLIREALAGLHALHTARHPHTGEELGFVHRDLSPRNLIATRAGSVRLIDLGLGRSRLGEWQTEAGRIMGSLGFMPPEQIRGEIVDHRADLWSIASVLFELITLQPFVPGKGTERALNTLGTMPRSLRELRKDVPLALDEVMIRALSTTPAARFESAASFARALAETCPEEEPDEMAAVVETMFGEELDERLARLRDVALTIVAPSPIDTKYQRIASRPSEEDVFGVFDATQVKQAPTRFDRPASDGPALPLASAATSSTPAATSSTAAPAPPPKLQNRWPVLAVVAALGAVALVYIQRKPVEQEQVSPGAAPHVRQARSAVSSAPPPAAKTKTETKAKNKTPKRRPSPSTSPPAPVRTDTAPPPKPVTVKDTTTAPTSAERIRRLSKRLQTLRKAHPEAVDTLILQLTALDLVTDPERHATELARLERAARALD